jgi:ABC-2 type transport system ATP-binding protein
MGQRLGIATALLGDPGVIMLDEPVNGLDPDGIQWIRGLLKTLAAEGRTVLVSSHLMSEVEQTADHLIVIGRGRILADMSMAAFIQQSSRHRVTVRSPQATRLAELLSGPQVTVTAEGTDCLHLEGIQAHQVGEIAAANQVVLHQLVDVAPSLEEVFMELTSDAVVFHGSTEVAR